MFTDYFSRAEFRAFVGDTVTPPRYTDALIDARQAEVIEALELWASSAWPTIDPAATTTDGKSTTPRSTTETFDGGDDLIVLTKLPVIDISTLTVAGVAVSSFTLYKQEGAVRFNSAPQGRQSVAMSYRYGYTVTPPTIKRAAMQATKALIDESDFGQRKKKIPRNTERYSTETASFILATSDKPAQPWPWDPNASADVSPFVERLLKVGAF